MSGRLGWIVSADGERKDGSDRGGQQQRCSGTPANIEFSHLIRHSPDSRAFEPTFPDYRNFEGDFLFR
jgi:hypothetical protein